jgi:DoxX-like family
MASKKTTVLLYWIFTILFAGLMIFSAIPNIMVNKQSVDVFHGFLGYPVYFIPFIGWAKLVGSITILIPGLKKLKEWAYAGLAFDLLGATYSGIAASKGNIDPAMAGMLMWIVPGILSYIFWTKKMNTSQ